MLGAELVGVEVVGIDVVNVVGEADCDGAVVRDTLGGQVSMRQQLVAHALATPELDSQRNRTAAHSVSGISLVYIGSPVHEHMAHVGAMAKVGGDSVGLGVGLVALGARLGLPELGGAVGSGECWQHEQGQRKATSTSFLQRP